jgi:hypothetical protein
MNEAQRKATNSARLSHDHEKRKNESKAAQAQSMLGNASYTRLN